MMDMGHTKWIRSSDMKLDIFSGRLMNTMKKDMVDVRRMIVLDHMDISKLITKTVRDVMKTLLIVL